MSIEAKRALLTNIETEVGDFLTFTHTKRVVNTVDDILDDFDVNILSSSTDKVDAESTDFLTLFLDAKAVGGRSEKTLNRYRYIIERALLEIGTPVTKITVYHIRRYLMHLQESGLNDNSVEGVRSILSSFFNWLWKENIIKINPMANIVPIKCKKEIRLPFSPLELELIRRACDNPRDLALVQFLAASGCRVGEVVKLDRDSIDFIARECKVLGKGNKERIVYIDPIAKLLIQQYLDSRTDNDKALFVGIRGRLTEQGVRKILKDLELKSGVENIHPHRFRRTLATMLIDRGMGIQEVGHILGHENINTTLKYVHIDDANVKAAYNKYTS